MANKQKIRIYKKNSLIKECNSELVAITWLLMKGYIMAGRGLYFTSPEIKVIRDFEDSLD